MSKGPVAQGRMVGVRSARKLVRPEQNEWREQSLSLGKKWIEAKTCHQGLPGSFLFIPELYSGTLCKNLFFSITDYLL